MADGAASGGAHQRQPAPLARTREGRDPPRDRGARDNAVWDLCARALEGKPLWKLLVRPLARGVRRESVDFRYLTDVLDRRTRRSSSCAARDGRRRACGGNSPRARASLRTRPRPAGSATRGEGRASAGGARRRVGATSRSRSAATSTTTCAASTHHARGDRRARAHGRREPGVGRRRGDRRRSARSRRSIRAGSRSRRVRTTCSATRDPRAVAPMRVATGRARGRTA